MGFLDRFRNKNTHVDKAIDAAEGSGDEIASGVDKVTDFVHEKSGRKHSEHLDRVDDAATRLGDELDAGTDQASTEDAPSRKARRTPREARAAAHRR